MVTLQLILAIVAIILVLVDLAVGGRGVGNPPRTYGSFLTPVAVILLAVAVLLPLATH